MQHPLINDFVNKAAENERTALAPDMYQDNLRFRRYAETYLEIALLLEAGHSLKAARQAAKFHNYIITLPDEK